MVVTRQGDPLHLRWLHALDTARPGLDHELLDALVNDRLWTPDFLNPSPYSPVTRFEDEVARLASTEPATVRRGLRAVYGTTPLPLPLRVRRGGVLARIVEAFTLYWRCCFAPYWPQMRALLEGDVTNRGR